MTDKSAAAIREFAEKQFPLSKELKKEVLYNQIQQAKQDELLSDLTALISEHYYPKAFTKWFRSEEFFNEFDEYVEDGKTYWEKPLSILIFETIDELFNYWANNEK